MFVQALEAMQEQQRLLQTQPTHIEDLDRFGDDYDFNDQQQDEQQQQQGEQQQGDDDALQQQQIEEQQDAAAAAKALGMGRHSPSAMSRSGGAAGGTQQ